MIEDNVDLAEVLTEFLDYYDMEVTNFTSAQAALFALECQTYDAVILDLSLPDVDGTQVCKVIRETSPVPIIISSARSDIDDKSICFNYEADDYLPKPYEPEELVLRIKSILRRTTQKEESPKLVFEVDEERMQVLHYGKLLGLTTAEFFLLSYLIKNENRIVSREEILLKVEGMHYESSEKSVDVLVGRVRKKLEPDPKSPPFIY